MSYIIFMIIPKPSEIYSQDSINWSTLSIEREKKTALVNCPMYNGKLSKVCPYTEIQGRCVWGCVEECSQDG